MIAAAASSKSSGLNLKTHHKWHTHHLFFLQMIQHSPAFEMFNHINLCVIILFVPFLFLIFSPPVRFSQVFLSFACIVSQTQYRHNSSLKKTKKQENQKLVCLKLCVLECFVVSFSGAVLFFIFFLTDDDLVMMFQKVYIAGLLLMYLVLCKKQ